MFKDVPLVVLASIVSAYWTTILLLVAYKRLRHGGSAGVLPQHPYERRLWNLIVPVVAAWLLLPVLAAQSRIPGFQLPEWAHVVFAVYCLRWIAAGCAVLLYLMSLYCWLLMGRNWSMAIVPGEQSQLVTRGIYRWVRHPIYALSVGLMVATLVVVPTVSMAVLACLHLTAMNLKARHEERYLEASFGPAYAEYCRKVGRFWPRGSWSN